MAAGEGMTLTAGEIASAMEGRLVSGAADGRIDAFSIDTRTLAAGDLFLAIRGTRFDGHAFVRAALAKGASGAVVADPAAAGELDLAPAPVLILVDETTLALQRLARYVRRASGASVVAITGSAGKTTTKELTAQLLAMRYRVMRNPGNLNNHIGLPLSLLELRHRPEVAVMELGMSAAGEVRTLVGIAEPDVRVWTNVAPVHVEFFESLDAVAEAKAEIFDGATTETTLVANAADPRIVARLDRFPGRVVTFAVAQEADVVAGDVRDLGLEGSEARVRTPAGSVQIRTRLLGRGNLANVVAAMAVALQFGLPLDRLARGVEGFGPPAHRGEVLRLSRGVTLVDDSYNSNPTALERALEVVRAETRAGRRVAVLGEMLELGRAAVGLHRQCGRAAAAAGLDALVTIGGDPARALGEAAVAAGLSASAVAHCADSLEAGDLVAQLVRPGDVVLVKGSRGVRTDRVVERLKAEFA